MNTQIWGPLFWQLLNDIAVVADHCYPLVKSDERSKFSNVFILFTKILPCKYCRESYTKFTKEEPPTYPFIEWIYKTHNKVNMKLKRPITLDLSVFKRRCKVYTSFGSTSKLWDLLFILAMNNDGEKKVFYRRFFNSLKWLYPTLVKFRNYDPTMAALLLDVKDAYLTTKKAMLQWILSHYPHKLSYKDLVLRFGEATAYKTLEEYVQVCGDLLLKNK